MSLFIGKYKLNSPNFKLNNGRNQNTESLLTEESINDIVTVN